MKKRYGAKAQLTMFFLLGILMVAIFVTIGYINTRSAETQLQAPQEKMIADLLKTGAVPYYVGLCLDKQATEALLYVGQQGGDIFWDQYGPSPNPSRYLPLQGSDVLDVSRISYGISRPPLQNGTVYPEPPGYPGGAGYTKQIPMLDFTRSGLFGGRSLRRVCDVAGANSPFIFSTTGLLYNASVESSYKYANISAPICLYDNYADSLSVQEQLEFYVEQTIVNCTNWTAIKAETGYNITRNGDTDAVFRYGLDDIQVDAYIPVKIEVGGKEPIYTIADFHTSFPVRLKKMFEFATLAANYDSYYLSWNLTNNYRGIYEWDTMISLTTINPYKPMVWDDIVTIMDMGSTLKGKPYLIRFVRENRWPALDRIHQDATSFPEFDIVAMEGQKMTILPNPEPDRIYDPDEDNLTYYYTGWKENCDDGYDPDTSTVLTTTCSDIEPTSPSEHFDVWNKGATVTDGSTPHNWTTSEEYISSGKNASYTPTIDDIGPHKVTVWVCDEAGLCDYQVVSILIVDYPELHINGTNPYSRYTDFIPYDAASVEDFYMLTAEGTSISDYSSTLIGGYVFADIFEPFEITMPDMGILNLPLQPPWDSRDIRNITQYNFSRARLNVNDMTPADSTFCTEQRGDYFTECLHTINLTLQGLYSNPAQMNVSVHQCLPYYDPAYPEPWPYNTTPDAFLASHTCCSPGEQLDIMVYYGISGDVSTSSGLDYILIDNSVYGDGIKEVKVYNSTGDVVGFSDGGSTLTENFDRCTEEQETALVVVVPDLSGSSTTTTTYGLMFPPIVTVDDTSEEDTTPVLGLDLSITYTNLPVCVFNKDNRTFSVIFNGVESGDYVQEGVGFGNYTITLTAKDDAVYPPWGAWFSSEHTCYGGIPKIGVYGKLSGGYDDVSGEDVMGAVQTAFYTPALFTDMPDEMWNDILLMQFERKCSGDRGNICTGNAEVSYSIEQECANEMSDGEIETCYGPQWSQLDPDGYLIPSGGETFACANYDPGWSFERKFGLNRYGTDVPADGTCNLQPTCGAKNVYAVTVDDGPYMHFAATCLAGECNKPITSQSLDCGDLNGTNAYSLVYTTPEETALEFFNAYTIPSHSCQFANHKSNLTSMAYSCSEPGGLPTCNFDWTDADQGELLCEACHEEFPTMTGPVWLSTKNKCCGDDLGEGGFPYGTGSKLSGKVAARAQTSQTGAGKYDGSKESTCDDYWQASFGSPFDPDRQIDNDCDNLKNCADNDCKTKKGPEKSYCCTIKKDCTQVLDVNFHTGAVSCDLGGNKECECSAITTSETATLPVKVCVPFGAFSAAIQGGSFTPKKDVTVYVSEIVKGYCTYLSFCKGTACQPLPAEGETPFTDVTSFSFRNAEPGSMCILTIELY